MSTSEQRKKLIERLSSMEDSFVSVEGSNGYGSAATVYLISSEGISEGNIGSDVGIVSMTQEEYDEAKGFIERGQEEEVDDEILDLIKQECKPGVEYVKSIFDGSFEEYEEFLFEAAEYSETTPWEEMSDEELEEWCETVDHMEKTGERVM